MNQKDAAAYLNISADSLHRYTKKGRIPAKRNGREVEYNAADIERLKSELGFISPTPIITGKVDEPSTELALVPRVWPQPKTPEELKKRLLLTVRDCQEMTGWKQTTILNAILQGHLNARFFDGEWFVRPSDLEATVQNLFDEPLKLPSSFHARVVSAKGNEALAKNVVTFTRQHRAWTGTTTQLFGEINKIAAPEDRDSCDWPPNEISFGIRLSRAAPALAEKGIQLYRRRGHSSGRIIQLREDMQLSLLNAL